MTNPKIIVWLMIGVMSVGVCGNAQKINADETVPDDVKAEIARLHSSDPIERIKAVCSLREKKTRALAAIPDLIALLGDDTPLESSSGNESSPGEEASYALGYEMGKAAFSPLLVAAESQNPIVRERAIWAFSEIALLIEMDTKERFHAPQAVGFLISALNDPDNNVRLSAAWALRIINDKRAVASLVVVLKDEALGKMKIVPRGFVSRMNPNFGNIRQLAAEALGEIGEVQAVEHLLTALHDSDRLVRRAAAESLGKLRDKRAYKPLVEALGDADMDVVEAAVSGLGFLGDVRAIDLLVTMLKDEKRDHFSMDSFDIDRTISMALEKLTGKDFKTICKQYNIKSDSTLVNISESAYPVVKAAEKEQPVPQSAPAVQPQQKKKVVIQGTIRYSDGTPVIGRCFYLVSLNTESGKVFIKFNPDGSEGIASAFSDDNGYFKVEADPEEFVKPYTPYTLIAYPGNNKKEEPFGIATKKGDGYWFDITPKTDVYDFDRIGGAVYTLKKEDDLSKAVGFSTLSLSAFKVNFFESGYDLLAKEQRVYTTEFVGAQVRYINWEFNLEYQDPGTRVDFVIEAVWRDHDDKEITRQISRTDVQAGWTKSWHCHSWGNRTPGAAWKPGTYSVELRIEDKRIARAFFTIN